jgi:hypothetical protein
MSDPAELHAIAAFSRTVLTAADIFFAAANTPVEAPVVRAHEHQGNPT